MATHPVRHHQYGVEDRVLEGHPGGILVLQAFHLVAVARLGFPGQFHLRAHQAASGPVYVNRKREMRPRSSVSPSASSASAPAGKGSLLCSTKPESSVERW